MQTTNLEARVLVFARAPRAGAAKTRLVPLLGAAGAAQLQQRLIEHTLAVAHAAGVGAVELHGAPDCEDPFLSDCAQHHGSRCVSQVEGDLGARMAAALESALAEVACAILIGTDCPALGERHLQAARDALAAGADAVFVPAEDGGYALVGLRRCDRRLFAGIAWGGAHVMAETRARLSKLGWRWQELETLWDIDRPDDYRRLVALNLLAEGRSSEDSAGETGS
ncbi:MAG TPA: TIGR04282 family arsenosugar biosynthesis glycosyltransferase [Burkholderiales bacterium]|nr:TIGR04282 family arsenosugar biosynthesis glycosyltransferase [Burkholderiales bacterium]